MLFVEETIEKLGVVFPFNWAAVEDLLLSVNGTVWKVGIDHKVDFLKPFGIYLLGWVGIGFVRLRFVMDRLLTARSNWDELNKQTKREH